MNNQLLSSLIYPIIAMENDNFLYISSGFLYRKKEKFYFITSLGTILGKEIPSGEFKTKNKKIPTHFEIKLSLFQNDLISVNKWCLPIRLSPYNDDYEPTFYIHPTYKKEIDIAVFPIQANGKDLIALNDFDTVKENNEKKEVFITGFPLFPNQSDDKTSPILEQSKITHQGSNILIMNPINRIGMFGSAVFQLTDLTENAFCFLGLFSGNHQNLKTPPSKPPFIWKKSFIEEIIEGQYKESCMD
ncbi:MAG: hypothetical protein J6V53_02340 [Alphaproteobacteria bacterium]|nr:hypothetical protein [Alphaproteobacteria bacterium]